MNQSEIKVRAETSAAGISATLQSPETSSVDAPGQFVDNVLARFHLTRDDLNPAFPVRFASAGAKHLILVARDRATLSAMKYQFSPIRTLMMDESLITISILWQGSDELFHSRNAFASGGVYEDPATGAAAAALAGYLRDIRWRGKNTFTILQGEDMGMPSRLVVRFGPKLAESVSVSGETRHINDEKSYKTS